MAESKPMCEICKKEEGKYRMWHIDKVKLFCLSCIKKGNAGKTLTEQVNPKKAKR